MDYAIPDNAEERCLAGGGRAWPAVRRYFGTAAPQTHPRRADRGGIPAYVSYTAGTYLCNQTLYSTLHEIGRRSLALRAGFIHVPLLPSMVAGHGREEPSMDLPLMLRALQTALSITATAE